MRKQGTKLIASDKLYKKGSSMHPIKIEFEGEQAESIFDLAKSYGFKYKVIPAKETLTGDRGVLRVSEKPAIPYGYDQSVAYVAQAGKRLFEQYTLSDDGTVIGFETKGRRKYDVFYWTTKRVFEIEL